MDKEVGRERPRSAAVHLGNSRRGGDAAALPIVVATDGLQSFSSMKESNYPRTFNYKANEAQHYLLEIGSLVTSFAVKMISLAPLLFLILDPFGNLVTLNTLLGSHAPKRRQLIILRESAIATGILLLAAFVGGGLLRALGLEDHALSISGGIVLFLIALGMLFPSRRVIEESLEESPLIVPIAMPFIADPSAISMVVLFSEKNS